MVVCDVLATLTCCLEPRIFCWIKDVIQHENAARSGRSLESRCHVRVKACTGEGVEQGSAYLFSVFENNEQVADAEAERPINE